MIHDYIDRLVIRFIDKHDNIVIEQPFRLGYVNDVKMSIWQSNMIVGYFIVDNYDEEILARCFLYNSDNTDYQVSLYKEDTDNIREKLWNKRMLKLLE